MSNFRNIAVIDIGKTNAKLAMVDLKTLKEFSVVTRPNRVLPGPPYPHFDVEGHWTFLLAGLVDFHNRFGIDAISITTHGACVALLDAQGGLAAPILDYEHDGPDQLAQDYDAIRPPFVETGSPRLAGGLNVGAQLYWQLTSDQTLQSRIDQIVTYPQFWAHRLTGIAAIDVTSIGCHTDLWNPSKGTFSTLVDRLGIRDKIAPVKRPDKVLGSILPEIAQTTGLRADTPVVCGIHDSNASLYPHLVSHSTPFSVVSTGTWVIAMAIGSNNASLDPDRDSLINVNALGEPVPSARFMGGREFEMVQRGQPTCADDGDIRNVLAQDIMLLPAVEPGSGPFQGRDAFWLPQEPSVGSEAREVALSFYLALMTAECLQIADARGDIILEGPFASNRFFQQMLQAETGQRIRMSSSATGTSIGAAMLFDGEHASAKGAVLSSGSKSLIKDLKKYAAQWKAILATQVRTSLEDPDESRKR